MHHHQTLCNQHPEGHLYLKMKRARSLARGIKAMPSVLCFATLGLVYSVKEQGLIRTKDCFFSPCSCLCHVVSLWAFHHLNRFPTGPYELDTGMLGQHQGKKTRKLQVLKPRCSQAISVEVGVIVFITITFILLIPVSMIGTTAEQPPRN